MPKKTSKRKKSTAAAAKKPPRQMSLLPPEAKTGVRRVLHVGCGPAANKQKLPVAFQGDDWQEVRLDIDPGVKPDIVADIMDMHMIADDSFDAVYSSHNLEHVYAYQVPQVLSEFFRVVKPGGGFLITLPDIQAVAFHVAEGKLTEPLYTSPAGPIAAIDILYGHGTSLARGQHYMAHKTAFTAKTLAQALLAAGFCNIVVERDNALNLWAKGNKLPKDHPQYQDKARVNGRYTKTVIALPDPDAEPGQRPDELDTEPKQWKKLGLRG